MLLILLLLIKDGLWPMTYIPSPSEYCPGPELDVESMNELFGSLIIH